MKRVFAASFLPTAIAALIVAAAVLVRADAHAAGAAVRPGLDQRGADHRQRQLDRRPRRRGLPRAGDHGCHRRRSADAARRRQRRRRPRRRSPTRRTRTRSRPAASPSSTLANPDDRAERLGHGRRAVHPARRSTRPASRGVRVALHAPRPRRLGRQRHPAGRAAVPRRATRAPSRTCRPASSPTRRPARASPRWRRRSASMLPAAAEDQPLVAGPGHDRPTRSATTSGWASTTSRSTAGGGPAAAGAVGRPTSASPRATPAS